MSRPPRSPATAAALLVLLGAGLVWPPPAAPGPRPALAQLSPARSAREDRLPVDVEGATVVEYDAQSDQYTFRGERVVVTRGAQRLEAPEIFYDGARRRALLPRRGTISTPTMELSADRITADLAARHVLAVGQVAGRLLEGGVWAHLSAARIEADDRPDAQRAEATGDVVMIRADEEVRGDRVTYDRLARRSTVEGHVVLTRGVDRLQADRIAIDLGTDDAEATGHVVLQRQGQEMRASADRAAYSRRRQVAVLSGRAVLVRGRDTLTAEQIDVDFARHLAVADGHPQIVAYPQEAAERTPPPR